MAEFEHSTTNSDDVETAHAKHARGAELAAETSLAGVTPAPETHSTGTPPPSAQSGGTVARVARALTLQRTIGNRAMQRMLARQRVAATPVATAVARTPEAEVPAESAPAAESVVLARAGATASGGAPRVQRHPGHPPTVVGGPSERRQHWQAAVNLEKVGVTRVPQIIVELEHAISHGAEPGIQAQLDQARAIDAVMRKPATSTGAQQKAFRKAIAVITNPFFNKVKATLTARLDLAWDPVQFKADKYAARATALVTAGSHANAAVQYLRANEIKPDIAHVFQAAAAFKTAGDKERAALWFRKLVAVPTYSTRAKDALRDMGKTEAALFTTTKGIHKEYTDVSTANLTHRGAAASAVKGIKESGLYAEEASTNVMFQGVTGMLLQVLMRAATSTAALARMEGFIANNLGVKEKPLKDLVLEFARWQIGAKGQPVLKVLADVQASYPAVVEADLTSGGWATLEALSKAKVKYLKTSAERAPFKLGLDGGLIKIGDPPGPVDGYDTAADSTNASGAGFAIFVMSADGEIYAASHKVDRFHHSSFLAGAEAAGAGEIKVTKGVLTEISNKSGHYAPGPEHLVQSIRQFGTLGPITATIVRYHTVAGKILSWTGGTADFLTSAADPVIFNRRVGEEVTAQGGWKK